MRTAIILGALALSPCLIHLDAADVGAAAEAELTVEERLAKVEAELAALRAELTPETLAQAIVDAQLKALQPPTTEEAVAKVEGLDEAKRAKVVELLGTQETEQQEFFAKMRSGDIPRDQIRDQMTAMREKHQAALGELLSEEQQDALRQAQRPPATQGGGRGGFGGFGGGGDRGNWGGRRGGGDNRGGGDRGGQGGGDAGGDTGRADF